MRRDHRSDANTNRQAPVADKDQGIVASYRQRVVALTKLGATTIQGDEDLQDQLARVANELTDLLRWEKHYGEAVELQEDLTQYLPRDTERLRITAATLKVEGGSAREGLTALREIAEKDPQNIWGWITLGANYFWTGQYKAAEAYLRRASEVETADLCDLASAHFYLFKLYGVQKRVDEAVNAWERAVELDLGLQTTVPELLRMLIHWYYYDTAEKYLPREQSELRRSFYSNLINVKRSPVYPRRSWEWVIDIDPKSLDHGQEEYAEACLRFVKPGLALGAIEPLIDSGNLSRQRLVLAGLAWAQQRMIDRAKWALDLALRAGDLERPRGTRPSVEGRRVLDTESRILYGEIIVDPDIREEVDRYFMPVVDNAEALRVQTSSAS